MPEGALINYLGRRVNPTPYLSWVPPVMAVYGQSRMDAAFKKDRPEYIVIIARNVTEFGVGRFGHDPRYGADLMRWIDAHYDRVWLVPGAGEPVPAESPSRPSLQILHRRPDDLAQGKI